MKICTTLNAITVGVVVGLVGAFLVGRYLEAQDEARMERTFDAMMQGDWAVNPPAEAPHLDTECVYTWNGLKRGTRDIR